MFHKEKRHTSALWKAFQISRKYFSFHMHFKEKGRLKSMYHPKAPLEYEQEQTTHTMTYTARCRIWTHATLVESEQVCSLLCHSLYNKLLNIITQCYSISLLSVCKSHGTGQWRRKWGWQGKPVQRSILIMATEAAGIERSCCRPTYLLAYWTSVNERVYLFHLSFLCND